MSDKRTTTAASEEFSTAVVEAVASAKGVDELDLPPLNDVVDPDALDALFRPGPGDGGSRNPGAVSFEYAGCDVTVYGNGDVDVST